MYYSHLSNTPVVIRLYKGEKQHEQVHRRVQRIPERKLAVCARIFCWTLADELAVQPYLVSNCQT